MFTLNCRGRLLVAELPLVMGILNISPDSFYEGSRISSVEFALQTAQKMLSEGADILDIGGQSSRPGALQIGVSEELDRVLPVVRAIKGRFPEAVLSIDTYHAEVAARAVESGASVVNDIGGGNLDPGMLDAVAQLGVPYICMHMKGDPETMQSKAQYESLAREILDYFMTRLKLCRQKGIHDVILDPGFGFAKNTGHNFELLRALPLFKICQCPLLIGLSRKSSIYKTLGITPEEALNGTSVLNTIGLLQGADILRVHDVKEAREAVKLVQAYRMQGMQ
jgi:dihydropteroate synthase